MKAEAADFASYKGGCTLADLEGFFQARAYQEVTRVVFASKEGVGRYYDVTGRNCNAGRAQGMSGKVVA